LQALVYSQDIAAIPSVTAKTIIVHLSSLPFYVIRKSPEGLMRFNVIFSRYHYILDTCVLHLIKISHKRNVKISVYLFKDSFRVYFYISRSEHVEFFFHSDKIFPDQFFGYYTIRMRIHRQTVSGIPPWFLQMRKLF